MKTCPKCEIEHSNNGKFCSRSCANSRGPRTEDFKISVRNKLLGKVGLPNINKGKYLVERISVSCLHCNTNFITKASEPNKYCSNICRVQKAGGCRPGSGRSKSGYYKGIYCGSTYELCWVIYNLDHGIKFSRFEGVLQNRDLKYYPDFLLDDGKTIIEIKGYEKQNLVERKTRLAESFGYNVKVLRCEDLKFAFIYVKEKYTNKFHTLYDGYRPNYTYVCSHCKNEFTRDKNLKTDVVFCSRQCSGRGHRGRVKF
jgi:hypothetical protein